MRMDVFEFVDLAGYEQRDSGNPLMTGENGVLLSLHHVDNVPPLYYAAAFVVPERRKAAEYLARNDGCLIECESVSVDGLPAVLQVLKLARASTPGRTVFGAAYVIPRADCLAMVQLEASEEPVTGVRELAVLDEVGFERCFVPHPYVPEMDGGRGFNAAYTREWDARFPDHPLSLVRTELDRIIPSVELTREFRRLPPFEP